MNPHREFWYYWLYMLFMAYCIILHRYFVGATPKEAALSTVITLTSIFAGFAVAFGVTALCEPYIDERTEVTKKPNTRKAMGA